MFDLTDFDPTDSTLPFRLDLVQRASDVSLHRIDNWPRHAAEAMVHGFDGPAMVDLASQYSDADSTAIRDRVHAAQDELGLRMPDQVEAARFVRFWICRNVVRETMVIPDALEMMLDHSDGNWNSYRFFVPAFDWDEFPETQDDITRQVKSGAQQHLEAMEATLEEELVTITTMGTV